MSDADIIDASFTEFDAITDTVDGKENTFIEQIASDASVFAQTFAADFSSFRTQLRNDLGIDILSLIPVTASADALSKPLLAIGSPSSENFATFITNVTQNTIAAAASSAKFTVHELDLIDNPDLELGSSFVSTTSTQNVSRSSPTGNSITKKLTTPKQSVTSNIAVEGFSIKPTNFTETFITPSNSITLKKIPSVITSVTGRAQGIVAGETVTLEFPLVSTGLQSSDILIKKRDIFSISGKTVTISQDIKKYDTVIIRYKFHSNYNPNVKIA